MRVAIFGGTGRVGGPLIDAALSRGFVVKALVRTPAKLGARLDRIEVIRGDYFDKDAVFRTIQGVEAVLSTLGPPMGRWHSVTPEDFETGMRHVVGSMKELGVSRFINLSSTNTRLPGERLGLSRRFFRVLLSLIAPVITPSKERKLAVLLESGVDWTNFRPPIITDKAKGEIRLDEEQQQGMRVNTGQLVELMLDSIPSAEWSRRAPFVGTR